MKTRAHSDRLKNRPSHLTYRAFCLAARDRTTGFLKWIGAAKSAHSLCPVKQKRALLESNLPRDNWIEGDEIKNVSTFGEAQTSPKVSLETFISEPEHALQNSSKTVSKSSKSFQDGQQQQKALRENYVSSYPFFRSKRTSDRTCPTGSALRSLKLGLREIRQVEVLTLELCGSGGPISDPSWEDALSLIEQPNLNAACLFYRAKTNPLIWGQSHVDSR
jgi:hypothetical protein